MGVGDTVRVSVAVLPVPPFVEVTAFVVLVYVPVVGALTFTFTVQVPPAAIVPSEKEIEASAAAGAKVGVPQPLVFAPVGLATCIWLGVIGKVSLKFTPVKAMPAFGLVMVKVRMDVPPARIGSGAKFFAILGGATTVRVSVAIFPVPPFVEFTALVELVYTPPVGAVTFTVTVHVPPAAIVPFEKEIDVAAAAGA